MNFIPGLVKIKSQKEKEWKVKISKNRHSYSYRYGEEWVKLSHLLRCKIHKCQWCNKQKKPNNLSGHHILCVRFNPDLLLDKRVIIIVCWDCHKLLESWSEVSGTQMLPQLFE